MVHESRRWATLLAVGAIVMSGCVDDGTTTKAGGDAAPLTLRIGTDDVRGRISGDQIAEFTRHVDARSNGQLQIEPVWQAAGGDPDDWDQAVASMVVDGELDMGVIPARSWDTMGVDSLRALHAPFLVTSDALVDVVVTDEIADDMLAGLDTIGITGLAMLPEGLRHIFSFADPVVTLDDFEGVTVRVPTSDTAFALFEALGAAADDLAGPGNPFLVGVADGSVAAAESSFALAGSLPAQSTALANVTLYPKVNVIVVNTDVLGGLSEEQQQTLRDAAIATRDWAVSTNRDDREFVAEFCDNGGRIALASEEERASLADAANVVYDELDRDDATAAAIARIRELATDVDPEAPIEECASAAVDEPDSTLTATDSSEFPEGVYRRETTADVLMAAGLAQALAFDHAGTWTLSFDDGTSIVEDDGPYGGTCRGRYEVDTAGRVVVTLGDDASCGDARGDVLFSAGWMLDGDELQFTEVQSGHGYNLLINALFGGQPFTKIG